MAKDRQNKNKAQFNIPDPIVQIDQILNQISKYKIGDQGFAFHHIRHLKPTFAFDYLSLEKSSLCFNSKHLVEKDFIGLLEGLKKVSAISYDVMSKTPLYRFHHIDFDDKRVTISRKTFKRILSPKADLLSDEEMPTLYQFDIQYVQEARVCGFLYTGIFYLVWYDRNHQIYNK